MDLQYLLFIIISDYLRGEPQDYDLDSYNDRFLKLNSAQKRQINRDRRRKRQGKKRTYAQDRAERDRKHKQAQNDPNRRDPYEANPDKGDPQFIKKRERQRQRDCKKNGGWACGWHGMDKDPSSHGGWDYDENHKKHYPN
eukprot:scaffold17118_cov61-Cyclotella_meneghiniana.AAC.2